jgi:hypothetical protein
MAERVNYVADAAFIVYPQNRANMVYDAETNFDNLTDEELRSTFFEVKHRSRQAKHQMNLLEAEINILWDRINRAHENGSRTVCANGFIRLSTLWETYSMFNVYREHKRQQLSLLVDLTNLRGIRLSQNSVFRITDTTLEIILLLFDI